MKCIYYKMDKVMYIKDIEYCIVIYFGIYLRENLITTFNIILFVLSMMCWVFWTIHIILPN